MSTLKQRLRPVWLKTHFYLGLWLGLVLVITGITGTLLVFYVEIDQWLNPQIAVQPQGKPQALEAVLATLKAQHPQRTGAWRLELPLASDRPLMARYYKPAETQHLRFAPLLVSVDPYRLTVTSNHFWGDTLMTWIYDLHYIFLIDGWGTTLMGIVGLLLAISIITGVLLWWPANANWRSAFRLRWDAGGIRRTYDLHKFGGILGLPVLLILAFSGFALNLPTWANPVINLFSPLSTMPQPTSEVIDIQQRITVDRAVAIAQGRFPRADVRWVETPKDNGDVYLVRMYQAGEPGRRFPKTMVWVDQYSGSVLAEHNALTRSAGDGLLAWLHPLHSGEALGLVGRIIVFLSGLLLPLSLVTGLLRWRQKARAKKHISQRKA